MRPIRTCHLRVKGKREAREPKVLAWLQSVADNPAKPAAERFVFRAVSHSLGRVVAVVKDQPMVTNGKNRLPVSQDESSAALQSNNLVLWPGQAAETVIPMPAALAQSAIDGVGVLIANNDVPADGELEVRICAEQVCRSSLESLSKSGNSPFIRSLKCISMSRLPRPQEPRCI